MPFRARRSRGRRSNRPSYLPDRYISPALTGLPPASLVAHLDGMFVGRGAQFRSVFESFQVAEGATLIDWLRRIASSDLGDALSAELFEFLFSVLVNYTAPAAAIELDRIFTGIDPSVSRASTGLPHLDARRSAALRGAATMADTPWIRVFPEATDDVARLFSKMGSTPRTGFGQQAAVAAPPDIPTTPPPTAFEPYAPTPGAWIELRLNAVDPYARQFATTRAATLVQRITTDQRTTIRNTISQLIANPETGMTIDSAISYLSNQIGLAPRWANAVNNRYLSMIGSGAEPSFAARIARDYAADLREKRAKMIVRTETLSASNHGREQAWRIAQDAGFLPRTLGREWLAAPEGTRDEGRRIDGPCEICKPLDGQIIPNLDDPFVHPDTFKVYALPPAHPNAVLLADSFVPYGGLIELVTARYDGPAVRIVTDSGADATVGPNHPVLTPHGLVRAKHLQPDDEIIHDDRFDGAVPGSQNNLVQVPSLQDGVGAVFGSSGTPTVSAAGHDFHGDGEWCEGEVHVVRPDRRLLPVLDSSGLEQFRYADLMRADADLVALTGGRTFQLGLQRLGASSNSSMGGSRPGDGVGSVVAEHAFGGTGVFPPSASRARIVLVGHVRFSGWAVDASTVAGIYNVGGVVVSNCRCVTIPVVPEV